MSCAYFSWLFSIISCEWRFSFHGILNILIVVTSQHTLTAVVAVCTFFIDFEIICHWRQSVQTHCERQCQNQRGNISNSDSYSNFAARMHASFIPRCWSRRQQFKDATVLRLRSKRRRVDFVAGAVQFLLLGGKWTRAATVRSGF